MKIRWKGTTVLGMWHNRPEGIKTGEIVDIDDDHAQRYIRHELAERVDYDPSAPHF